MDHTPPNILAGSIQSVLRKRFLYFLKFLCSAVLAILSMSFSAVHAGNLSIVDLRSAGWIEVKKYEEEQKLIGVPPYEKLTRVIHFTHFVFEKAGERKVCWISYDSQRDQVQEGCKPDI